MRQYEPVWNELKKKKVARITAHRALHPRIIKAVIKEKWMDVGYKIEIDPYHAFISYSIKHSIVTFTLTLKLNTANITENML
jgi:hypothetical protein